MEKWQSLPFAQRRNLPTCVAVYAILADGKVLYIGSTWDLVGRVCRHNVDFELHGANLIKWIEVMETDLAIEEARAIGEFKPLLNKGRNMNRKPKPVPQPKVKFKSESPQILTRTLELLRNRPAELTLPMIERDTGLSVPWLNRLLWGKAKNDPGTKRIVKLYEYLSHNKLVAP